MAARHEDSSVLQAVGESVEPEKGELRGTNEEARAQTALAASPWLWSYQQGQGTNKRLDSMASTDDYHNQPPSSMHSKRKRLFARPLRAFTPSNTRARPPGRTS